MPGGILPGFTQPSVTPSPLMTKIFGALANVATMGNYQNPGSLEAYGKSQLQSLDPRSTSGLVNLASILVPGGKGGRGGPSYGQEGLLNAINESSRGFSGHPVMLNHPSTRALADQIGAPANSKGNTFNPYISDNPLDTIIQGSHTGSDNVGARDSVGFGNGPIDRRLAETVVQEMLGNKTGATQWLHPPLNRVSQNPALLQEMLKMAIKRRN